MTSTALIDGLIGAIIGALVAGVGVFLTYRSMKVAARDDATQAMLELDRLFVEHPKLRRYIAGDAPIPAEHGEARDHALAVVELVSDTLEAILDKVKQHPVFNMYSNADRKSWK